MTPSRTNYKQQAQYMISWLPHLSKKQYKRLSTLVRYLLDVGYFLKHDLFTYDRLVEYHTKCIRLMIYHPGESIELDKKTLLTCPLSDSTELQEHSLEDCQKKETTTVKPLPCAATTDDVHLNQLLTHVLFSLNHHLMSSSINGIMIECMRDIHNLYTQEDLDKCRLYRDLKRGLWKLGWKDDLGEHGGFDHQVFCAELVSLLLSLVQSSQK